MLDHKLVAYLDTMNIKYVADYPGQIFDVTVAATFGYSLQEMKTRLHPMHSNPKFNSRDFWSDYTLYRLSSADDRSSSQKNR